MKEKERGNEKRKREIDRSRERERERERKKEKEKERERERYRDANTVSAINPSLAKFFRFVWKVIECVRSNWKDKSIIVVGASATRNVWEK
jgi:hypothetical protein